MEQFLVVGTSEGMLVLDAGTGNTLRTLPSVSSAKHYCAFISDDKCVISHDNELPVQLVNVKSGEVVSGIDVESDVTCLAACPFNRVLAIGLQDSTPNFRVIKVHFPLGDNIETGKR